MSMRYTTIILAIASFAATSIGRAQNDPYVSKCQMCHGATGLADTQAGKAMGAHAFKSPEVMKESDATLIAVIKNGKGKMPGFSGKLTDAEISAVVAHLHTLQK